MGTPVPSEGERGCVPRIVRRVLHATRRRRVRVELWGSRCATQPQFWTRLNCTGTFYDLFPSVFTTQSCATSSPFGLWFSNGDFLIMDLSLVYVSLTIVSCYRRWTHVQSSV